MNQQPAGIEHISSAHRNPLESVSYLGTSPGASVCSVWSPCWIWRRACMARGLVRMERESGFCICEQRQKDTAVPTSESFRSQRSTGFECARKSAQRLSPCSQSEPASLVPPPSLQTAGRTHRDPRGVQIQFPKGTR